MKITNVTGLPEAIVRAMENDPYDKGDSDFTATSLIKPARISQLEVRHAHELADDAEDGLYRLYGQLVHGLLERANLNDLCEKRFFGAFEVCGRIYKVSAQMDSLALDRGVLSDFKFTTSYGFKKDKGPKPEWIAQLNIQKYLMAKEHDVKKLQIVGLLRDWQINGAKADYNYPQAPVQVVDIPIWTNAQVESFIKMRIAAHLDAKTTLPECAPTEYWEKKNEWAVIKKGQKRAIRGGVQYTEEAALKVQAENPGTFIQYRPGERTRCLNYCAVNKFCTQYQRTLNQNKNEESESA